MYYRIKPTTLPTNEELLSGKSSAIKDDAMLQLALAYTNVGIEREFAKRHTDGDKLGSSTVGARISRGLDGIADRDTLDRTVFEAEFHAERDRNGVAGRNQHTKNNLAPQTPEPDDDISVLERIMRYSKLVQASGDAVVKPPTPASLSPLAENGQLEPVRPSSPSAGDERSWNGDKEDGGESAGPQHGGRPTKRTRTDCTAGPSTSTRSGLRDKGNGKPTRPQHASPTPSIAATSPAPSRSASLAPESSRLSPPPEQHDPSPSENDTPNPAAWPLLPSFEEFLNVTQANAAFSDEDMIHDDLIMGLAEQHTSAEIARMANRGAGDFRHDGRAVGRRIRVAVQRMATRKGLRVDQMEARLERKRRGNGLVARRRSYGY